MFTKKNKVVFPYYTNYITNGFIFFIFLFLFFSQKPAWDSSLQIIIFI